MAEKSTHSDLTLEQAKEQLVELGKNAAFLPMKKSLSDYLHLILIPIKWMNIMSI